MNVIVEVVAEVDAWVGVGDSGNDDGGVQVATA